MRIEFTRSANKEWQALPKMVQRRFQALLAKLAEDRPRVHVDARPLVGGRGVWRVRVGRHRGVFQAEDEALVFTRFGHRGSVYR